MNRECENIKPLMSGVLDNELDAEQTALLQEHIENCDTCRTEFEEMKTFISTTSQLRIESPPEEVWDTFLDGVYNRLERKTGWLVFIVGAIILTGLGLYFFIMEPWASALEKLAVAVPVIGLIIVFISVLRQRLHTSKTDRYSKEIQR